MSQPTTFTFSDEPFTVESYDTTLTSNSYNARSDTLTEVSIGSSVTTLAANCFAYCSSLTNVVFSNNVITIGNYCFDSCSSLTSIVIPNNVTTIGGGCFYYCGSLASVSLPNNITTLSDNCFENCTNLLSITIPSSVTSIGPNCFVNCYQFTSITIPSNVTTIGYSCFSNCGLMNTITFLGNSITVLDDNTFDGCESLASITIPSSVTTIGNSCFSNCYLLRSLVFNNQNNLATVGTTVFASDPSMNVLYYNTASISNLSSASVTLKSQIPSGSSFTYISDPPCFCKGTRILCLSSSSYLPIPFGFVEDNLKVKQEQYIPIEELQVGDLVKTHLNGYIPIQYIGSFHIPIDNIDNNDNNDNNDNKRSPLRSLYKHKTENLIVTGGHSLLIDKKELTIEQEETMKQKWNFSQQIEDKQCILACISPDFELYKEKEEKNSNVEIYHLVLKKGHYGIYAENVLTESCTEKAFAHFFKPSISE